MNRLTVGETPQTRDSFVQVVVDLEVLALQFPVPLPAIVEARKVDLDVFPGLSGAAHQGVTVRAKGDVDEPGGVRPVGIVQCSLVQRCQDLIELVPVTHTRTFCVTCD